MTYGYTFRLFTMPLIIFCGFPCSGKSELAKQLCDYFSEKRKTFLVQDHNVGSDFQRNEIYSDLHKEKELRSALKSEVQRHISKDAVVILDAANYIKGYRYELYCLSKGCKTTHCVVHCDIISEDCWKFNESRPVSMQYSREIFDALVQRFETPDSRNRWDSPLFTILAGAKLPLEAIDESLFQRKAPPPNLSTQCQPLSSANFLHELDKITQDIVQAIITSQKTCVPGDMITVSGATEKITYFHPLSALELTKLRRQFISYTKSHPVSDSSRIPNMFVQYVNSST